MLDINKKKPERQEYKIIEDKEKRGIYDHNSRYFKLKFVSSQAVTDSLWLESWEREEIPKRDSDIYIEISKGDRLDQLSYKYYGTSRLWWVLAIANNIQNPFIEIKPGTLFRIPDISLKGV